MAHCDAHLEALGDSLGALDEVGGRDGRADFVRGLAKELQPAVEMAPVDGQRQMLSMGRPWYTPHLRVAMTVGTNGRTLVADGYHGHYRPPAMSSTEAVT